MISNRLSRWTLLFFACALVNFVLAQALILAGFTYPAQSWASPGTLIVVHLMTVGWLLLLMLGALFQFVPVITSKMLPSQHLALVTLLGIQAGLIGMVCGFAGLALGITPLTHCLPAGGALVIASVLLAIYNIGVPLVQARPLPLPGRMVLTALMFLVAAIGLGMLMALALSLPGFAAHVTPLLVHGVGYHALTGLGGWFTIAAMGVSYKLFPMFTLAPEERGLPGELAHYLSASGFAIAVGAGLAHAWQPSFALFVLERTGYALVIAAIVIYLTDIVRIYRTRKRTAIELQNKAAIGAFALLGIAALLAIALLTTGVLTAYAPILVFLVLFGWLSGLGLTQLYKIVPFLTWLGRFGKKLGHGRVPRVQDLVNEKRTAPWFVIYFAGVVLAALAAFGDIPYLFRAGVVLTAVATIRLMLEYWRAWRGYYEHDRPATPPVPPHFMSKEGASHDRS